MSAGWDDGKVIIWNARDGEVVYAIPGDFEDVHVRAGNWSPSGDRFTIRGWGGTKIFDTTTGQQILNISTPQVHCFRDIWSPDGTRLLTTGIEDGAARIWDAYSGQELHTMTGLVQGRGSDWSPVKDLAAVGGHDSFVHLWDVVSGREINKFSGTLEAPYHIAFSPDGERLLTLGASHNVNIYDLSEAQINIPMKTYGGISIPSWSPDGKQIAFDVGHTANFSLKIWDTCNGQELIDHLYDQIDTPGVFSWSPSGDRFFTSDTKTDSIHIWDTTTWLLLKSFTSPDKPSEHYWGFAAWSPDGKQIVINSYEPHIVIWDVITGERHIINEGHEGQVLCVAWSPDGELILSNGTKGEAMIWEAATGQSVIQSVSRGLQQGYCSWCLDQRQSSSCCA